MVIWAERGDILRLLEIAQEIKEEKRRPRKPFNLRPFFPLIAATVVQITTGGVGEQEAFEASVEYGVDEEALVQAIDQARNRGVEPAELARASTELITLRPRAFGDLSPQTLEAIEDALTVQMERVFAQED